VKGHYTTFLGFARKYADNIAVDKRWKEWIVLKLRLLQIMVK
jgi:tRNA-(ms[2]io[6]A)-hydroxylase